MDTQQGGLSAPKPSEVKRKSVGDLASMFEQKGAMISNQFGPPQIVAPPKPIPTVTETKPKEETSQPRPVPTLSVNAIPAQQTQVQSTQPTKSPGRLGGDRLNQLNNLPIMGAPPPKRQSAVLPTTSLPTNDQNEKQEQKDTVKPSKSPGKLNNDFLNQLNTLPVFGANPANKRGSAVLPTNFQVEEPKHEASNVQTLLERPTHRTKKRNSMQLSMDLGDEFNRDEHNIGIFASQQLKPKQTESTNQLQTNMPTTLQKSQTKDVSIVSTEEMGQSQLLKQQSSEINMAFILQDQERPLQDISDLTIPTMSIEVRDDVLIHQNSVQVANVQPANDSVVPQKSVEIVAQQSVQIVAQESIQVQAQVEAEGVQEVKQEIQVQAVVQQSEANQNWSEQ